MPERRLVFAHADDLVLYEQAAFFAGARVDRSPDHLIKRKPLASSEADPKKTPDSDGLIEDKAPQPANETVLVISFKTFGSLVSFRTMYNELYNAKLESETPDQKSIRKFKQKKIRAKIRGSYQGNPGNLTPWRKR